MVLGPGTPCEIRNSDGTTTRLPHIVQQADLASFNQEEDVLLIENPDDLAECYRIARKAFLQAQRQYPDLDISIDYTGGTKSMSLGIGMAAIDEGIDLYVTTGTRSDLVAVRSGEATERAATSPVKTIRVLEGKIPHLLAQYNYGAAVTELDELLRQSEILDPSQKQRIRNIRGFCLACDAWDRFDHAEALALLESLQRSQEIGLRIAELKRILQLKRILENGEDPVKSSLVGYELVEDLLCNAERRAEQRRYDDAVGRIYRAFELLGQLRLLFEYGINTSNVDITKLPEHIRPEYETAGKNNQSRIQLPLWRSFELLVKLEDKAISALFTQRRSQLLDALQARNNSLFAHGLTPRIAQ